MKFNRLDEADIGEFRSMVSSDRFSTGESNLDLHSRDQSRHRGIPPEAVIWPIEQSEVSEILRYANRRLIPIIAWGSGSSLEGNPVPAQGGVVLDFSRMNRVLEVRDEDFQADIEPGVIYQDLNESLRHKGLFFPPDPGARATIGGMISNNASGTRTVRYGATKDNILKLTVVLANGEVIETGTRASKTSSGYDLIHLFTGSEGTLGVVTKATVRLVGLPVEFSAAIATFPHVEAAARAVFEIIRSGCDPAFLELLAPECIELINKEMCLGLNPSPTLFMEFHGITEDQPAEILGMVEYICEDQGCEEFRSGLGRDERGRLLKARHDMAEMIRRNHPDCSPMVTDVAVPLTAYSRMIALARKEAHESDIPGYIFSHAGDGNIHLHFEGKSGDEKVWQTIDRINEHIVSEALKAGGTATGEHGVGMGKRRFMEQEHGSSLIWMRQIKQMFDPNGILNPGKIFLDGE